MSAIVRTNGLGRTAEELSLDLAYLIALWDEINNTMPNAKSPSLIFRDDKLIVLYTYESDLGDGWENSSVHNCPEELRENALKMGVNIIYYYSFFELFQFVLFLL